ncbi:MAG: hypothetical protein ACO3JG_00960 [Luteolibacter sp.]
MKTLLRNASSAVTAWLIGISICAAEPVREVPEALKPWTGWALWDEHDLDSPRPYDNAKQALQLWPSRLALEADAAGGSFALEVVVFNEAWLPLPGDGELWPVEVMANGEPLPVVAHAGKPSVKLGKGSYQLTGAYPWQSVPQRIAIPPEIGILRLRLDGAEVASPVWDAKGFLWLKRDASTEQVDRDFLAAKSHLLISDGIPLWLHVELELIVAGKSREETIGHLLPEGWRLTSYEGPLPVAVDDAGLLKAQVRSGKWTLRFSASRLDHPKEVRYAENAKPVATGQLVAFEAAPDFRLVEITGIPVVDVSQTQFPEAWRRHPVYRWETGAAFQMQERMRGMGMQKPEGLHIERELWLDEDGGGFTFRDKITGPTQQIWRLDAKEGQELGSVRSDDTGQLITRNPATGATGVEIRQRHFELEATGRAPNRSTQPATGWRTDAAKAEVTLNLPPGWRLFALFGADWVRGDWLTAWSLLDLFLLLVFTLAVFRLWGFGAALLAFVGFGLSYHEPGAPKYVWLALLVPLALLRVVPPGWARHSVVAVKWLVVVALLLVLVPFAGRQIQQALYPQLERVPYQIERHSRNIVSNSARMAPKEEADPFAGSYESSGMLSRRPAKSAWKQSAENLQYDLKARIQTGPGVPEWRWLQVGYGWNGPVTEKQSVRPVLIPAGVERVVSLARVLLLLGLGAVLLGTRRPRLRVPPAAAALLLLGCLAVPNARAELPDKQMLETLRARLTEIPDAFPNAADIPHVALTLHDRRLSMEVEIHTAARAAVPLPGKLPEWSPLSVTVDGAPAPALRRGDGFLWLVLPQGVHRVRVEGSLADLSEWQWTWKLRPRRVTIDAPGWQVGGVKPGGIPEAQVFFAREVKAAGDGANYDRPNLQTVVAVERRIELGLVWQVSTNVRRLSSGGGAVSLRIPLLPGESVLTPGAVVRDGFIEVRLGTGQDHFAWGSELAVGNQIELTSRADDTWVERWLLNASPVWNVGISGLAPVFDESEAALIPEWRPWPGESATLEIGRPQAVTGATVTIDRARHEITLGKRQRTSTLQLSLRSSLGEDFLIGLPASAEPTSLTSGSDKLPIRREGANVIVPLTPGAQEIHLQWRQDQPLDFRARAGAVTLPVESANITTTIQVPDDRWVLWTDGPLRGPAVRFWGILLGSLLAAWVLGRLRRSPLRTHEWMLLAVGLTQIPLPGALVVVGWLFVLAWRGGPSFPRLPNWLHNTLQALLALVSLGVMGIFIGIVAAGLLGSPEMFISGNGSTRSLLSWYQARGEGALPQPGCLSISVWWYRLLMLLWALWLAAALIRWLTWGWRQFNTGGCFLHSPKVPKPPPLPPR